MKMELNHFLINDYITFVPSKNDYINQSGRSKLFFLIVNCFLISVVFLCNSGTGSMEKCVTTVTKHRVLARSDSQGTHLRYFGRHFVFCSKKVSEIIQFQCRFSSNLIGLTAKEISGNKDK
jgi:hypothetical protein